MGLDRKIGDTIFVRKPLTPERFKAQEAQHKGMSMENLECGCRPGVDTPVLLTGNRHNQSVIDGLPKMGLAAPVQGFDWLVIYQEGLGLPLQIKQFETAEDSVDFLDEQIERNLARDLHAATCNGRVN